MISFPIQNILVLLEPMQNNPVMLVHVRFAAFLTVGFDVSTFCLPPWFMPGTNCAPNGKLLSDSFVCAIVILGN